MHIGPRIRNTVQEPESIDNFSPQHTGSATVRFLAPFAHKLVVTDEFLRFLNHGFLSVEARAHCYHSSITCCRCGATICRRSPRTTPRRCRAPLDGRTASTTSRLRIAAAGLADIAQMTVDILEPNNAGQYLPVEVNSRDDVLTGGVYMIRPGYAHRISVALEHEAGAKLGIYKVTQARLGNIALVSKDKAVATHFVGEFDELKVQFDKRVREAKSSIDALLKTHDPPIEKARACMADLCSCVAGLDAHPSHCAARCAGAGDGQPFGRLPRLRLPECPAAAARGCRARAPHGPCVPPARSVRCYWYTGNLTAHTDNVQRSFENIDGHDDEAKFIPLYINSQGVHEQTGQYRVVASWDPAAHEDVNLNQPTKDNVRCCLQRPCLTLAQTRVYMTLQLKVKVSDEDRDLTLVKFLCVRAYKKTFFNKHKLAEDERDTGTAVRFQASLPGGAPFPHPRRW